ncbi:NAD+ diphosphatase [Selenomonas sp. GACV-9]|uniref:NAD(+) diphosphatase n=1 Tax=Selenomonas sp. GACV-9 TaxID=3158782 RepID=UPI0008EDC260|nr:NAD+ diphosphatase [Selenomonas ruminantium]
MIHEISPLHLANEYIPNAEPWKDDIIIFVKGNALMVGGSKGAMCFPKRQDIRSNQLEYQYLFSLAGHGVYYAQKRNMEPLPGFSYMTLKEMRWQLQGPQANMYLVYTAWHLITWYEDNRFCGRCGHMHAPAARERALVCDNCGHVVYPRIIPAVVAGVINGDEILLTKYANRDVPFYALVAGFTEIGETLEECVAREVMEETGLKVKNIRYYKSQPWGSVQDLIVGFYCEVDGDTAIHMDKSELKEAVWVKRANIQGQPDDWSLTHHMMMTFKEGREPKSC